MALYASWAHGNAVVAENPENMAHVGHFGWGSDMAVNPGRAAWFHVPVPTPVMVGDVRVKLQRFFLLFNVRQGQGEIRNVRVYDGGNQIQAFDGRHLFGEHRGGLDAANTFVLSAPHPVAWGIGISFMFQAAVGFDTEIPPPVVSIASVGGDFLT
jgi:hypothetical protein